VIDFEIPTAPAVLRDRHALARRIVSRNNQQRRL